MYNSIPVVFIGLVGGFLKALGFTVKPLKSDSGAKFLKPGELGVIARSEDSGRIVEVVRR